MSGEGINNPADLTDTNAAIAVNQALLVTLQASLAVVDGNVDAVRAIAEAQGVLENTGGTITTDGTEQNIYINNAPAGLYVPKWLNIDFTNQTAGETVMLRVYHRNIAGGAWVSPDTQEVEGVPEDLLVWVALNPSRYGCRVTIEKTGGVNRAYIWEVVYKI